MKNPLANRQPPSAAAFTLIELMMVVGVLGLVAAMSIPSILQMRREEPMRKAVNDVLEICARARAGAILHDTTTSVVFHPRNRRIELQGGDSNVALSTRTGNMPVSSTEFDPSVTIEGLGVDLMDYTDAEYARVRFFPNGTCDEMTMVLESGGHREMVSLELTTALASVQAMQ